MDDPDTAKVAKFTAIVFIHGIGRHARHENAGKFLQALEAAEKRGDERMSGALRSFRPRVEPAAQSGRRDIEFMEFTHYTRGGLANVPRPRGRFRMYEDNWSPLTKSGLAALPVLGWIIGKLPWRSGDWLAKPVMRQAALQHARLTELSPSEGTWAELLGEYRRFRGATGDAFRAKHGVGTGFRDLSAFLKERATAREQGTEDRWMQGARAWARTRLPCEERMRATVVLLLAAVTAVLAASAAAAIWGADTLGLVLVGGRAPVKGLLIQAALVTLGLVAIGVVAAVSRLLLFVGTIFSDVRFWASIDANDVYSDVRERILSQAVDLLSHVAQQPECTRIVVVAHSLGTAIAFDALREIERRNEARSTKAPPVPMLKLSHLVTLGSPIDKLTYLFELHAGSTYRAMSLRERLRGDLGDPPFWSSRRARARWINMWDRSDPVCDPLYTPLGTTPDGARVRTATIENVEVENTRLFNPLTSHVRYLDNPMVLDRLFDVIFFNGKGRHAPPAPMRDQRLRHVRRLSQLAIMAAAPAVLAPALAAVVGTALAWTGVLILIAWLLVLPLGVAIALGTAHRLAR